MYIFGSYIFGSAAGILGLIAYMPYIWGIVRGTTRPERASWFIWLVLGGIAFGTQRALGAGYALWMTGAQLLGVMVIVPLSLWRGQGGFLWRDIAALLIAALGVGLWYITQHPLYALLAVLLADSAGIALTIVKAYADPESETMSAWAITSLSGACALLAEWHFSPLVWIYPLYIFTMNLAVVAALYRGRRHNRSF